MKKLMINKCEFFLQIRKLYLVLDYWILFKMIGSVVIIILIVVGMLIILVDISFILFVYFKKKFKKRKVNKFV